MNDREMIVKKIMELDRLIAKKEVFNDVEKICTGNKGFLKSNKITEDSHISLMPDVYLKLKEKHLFQKENQKVYVMKLEELFDFMEKEGIVFADKDYRVSRYVIKNKWIKDKFQKGRS